MLIGSVGPSFLATNPMALVSSSTFAAVASSSSSGLLSSVVPKLPLLLAATSSTALFQERRPSAESSPGDDSRTSKKSKLPMLSPRARSCVWMALAMSLHFGGYEFARSGALALFTSSDTGFSHPSAYPFAIGLVTPVSLALLYGYGLLLRARGPRYALRTTKWISVMFLLAPTLLIKMLGSTTAPATTVWTKLLVGILFVFQNSYAHLIYTQQWSFLGSVMTPTEGTKWFSPIAGICSLVCTFTATLVHRLVAVVGLLGLILGTAGALFFSLLLADRAYQLGEEHGFDPSEAMQHIKKKKSRDDGDTLQHIEEKSLLMKTVHLFQRVPTLGALFLEVISFQSLSTVLNVFFVHKLKEGVPVDTDRAAFTGRFYAYINGSSTLMQFFVLPLARNYLEPKWVYRLMPVILLPLLVYSAFQSSSLYVAAAGFFALKTMDYSLRNVVNEMVYQPLDFESRYLGKEVVGVFANRFGKSGMSMILSLLAPLGVGVPQLSQLAVAVGSIWTASSVWLSRCLVTNVEAERLVQERRKDVKKE